MRNPIGPKITNIITVVPMYKKTLNVKREF